MKLSVFTVSTPEYDVNKTIEVLKELGYDGVEWRTANRPPASKPDTYTFQNRYWSYNLSTIDINSIYDTAHSLGKLCVENNLEVCSLSTYLNPTKVDEIEKVAKAASMASCKNIRVALPKYNQEINYKTQFFKAIDDVKALQKIPQKYNIRINFEIHMGNIIPSASAAYRFISNFSPEHFGLIYDIGNMVYEGFEDYKLGIELLDDYLAYVHIKNAKWELEGYDNEGAEIWKPSASLIKKGYADIPRIIRVLKEKNYEGFLSIEDFSNEEDTYTKLKNNLEYLKKLINE